MTSPKNLAPAQAKTSSPKPNSQPSPGSIGNTPGLIIPQPSPNGGIEAGKPTALTDPPAKTETPAEKGLIDKALDLYEKGNIGFLEKLQKAGLDKIDVMVESSGYSMPAMVAGAIGKAVLEVFMPTNVVDLVPGGKGASLTKKGADATGALKKGKKATEAAKDTGKADNAKPVGKEDGGYSKGTAGAKKKSPCDHPNDKKKPRKYVVYKADEFDKDGNKIGTYVGRTSGAQGESTRTILKRRQSGHHRNVGPLDRVFETDSYSAVRGAEQIYRDKLGTSKQINPISPKNKRKQDYLDCAESKGAG